MRKWLKRCAITLLVIAALPVLTLLVMTLMYLRVVNATPGNLAVDAFPGPLGGNVNPFIGTGGIPWVCAQNTPAAQTPFGMMRLGPDTASLFIHKTAFNYSGYYYGDDKIIGFSHTRIPGAGVVEGGNFRIFPTTTKRTGRTPKEHPFYRFSHSREKAFPGYYAVWLPKDEILAELTATGHTGIHRYTYSGNSQPRLQFDITSAQGNKRCENGMFRILPDKQEIEGSVRAFGSFSGRYDGLDLYFVVRFNRPFSAHQAWVGESLRPGAEGAVGNDTGIYLDFAPQAEKQTIEVRLAISCVSIANARENLVAETSDREFEALLGEARNAWEGYFRRITLQGGTEKQKTIFYTALYRAFQTPTRFNDVNGQYRGFDKEVHLADGFSYYTDFSLWDTFRTVHPLYNLIAREEQGDMMTSLVEMAKTGGALPRWPSGCGYTGSMFGTPADMAVTEAYLKGVRDFDIETAYASMRRTALEGVPPGCRFGGRDGLEWHLGYGYCPSDKMGESVASTLEYAWADYSISLLAQALGKQEDAVLFARHAGFYRNLWNPQNRYFHPRDSQGAFSKAFKPDILTYVDFDKKYTAAYVEGSAMQWRWSVPFDPEGLIALFPDKETFVRELEAYMEGVNRKLGNWNPGPYYWHGNEPYFHAAYLFIEAGRPDLTQKWVRWILKNKYDVNYIGLDGNDDCGTLSAWYVLSAVGIYPIAGTTKYWIGAPLFERANIQMGPGTTLTILAENNPADNPYVQHLWLNDVPLDRFWLNHDEIANGGTLRFEMGPEPAKK